MSGWTKKPVQRPLGKRGSVSRSAAVFTAALRRTGRRDRSFHYSTRQGLVGPRGPCYADSAPPQPAPREPFMEPFPPPAEAQPRPELDGPAPAAAPLLAPVA